MRSIDSDKGEGQPAGSTGASQDGNLDGGGRTMRIFHGPRNLDATAMKYMYPFKEAEEIDGSGKCPRLQHSVSHVSAQLPPCVFYEAQHLNCR
jgi:hypothetical protein